MTASTRERQRGSVMPMTAVLIVFLMMSFWALMSASQQWNTRRDVNGVAATAARAAAQGDPAAIRAGIMIDPHAAAQRGQQVIAEAGYAGTVTLDGLTVTATVTGTVDYAYPTPGFTDSVTATAQTNLVRGITGDEGA